MLGSGFAKAELSEPVLEAPLKLELYSRERGPAVPAARTPTLPSTPTPSWGQTGNRGPSGIPHPFSPPPGARVPAMPQPTFFGALPLLHTSPQWEDAPVVLYTVRKRNAQVPGYEVGC